MSRKKALKKSRKGQKPKLKPGVDTVLIGCKGPKDLKERLQKSAKKLGLSYSDLLRAILTDFDKKFNGG